MLDVWPVIVSLIAVWYFALFILAIALLTGSTKA